MFTYPKAYGLTAGILPTPKLARSAYMICCTLTLLCGCQTMPGAAYSTVTPDKKNAKLQQLEAALYEKAQTQLELNIASAELAAYLDERLVELEDKIRPSSNKETLTRFNEAASLWRKFRDSYAAMVQEHNKTGSIRGLMANSSRVGFTEERITALQEDMLPK